MDTMQIVAKGQGRAVELAEGLAASQDKRITVLVKSAGDLVIDSTEDLKVGTELLREVKGRKTDLTEQRLSITRPMDAAKKRVMELFRPALDKLDNFEKSVKGAMLAYAREQERLQCEEQERLNLEAERERKRLLNLADKRQEEDKTEKAETFLERAEGVEAEVAAPAARPTGAVHVRTTWSAEVTDLAALVGACAKGAVPLELIEPNMLMLNKRARDDKEKLDLPGVVAVSERNVAVKA